MQSKIVFSTRFRLVSGTMSWPPLGFGIFLHGSQITPDDAQVSCLRVNANGANRQLARSKAEEIDLALARLVRRVASGVRSRQFTARFAPFATVPHLML